MGFLDVRIKQVSTKHVQAAKTVMLRHGPYLGIIPQMCWKANFWCWADFLCQIFLFASTHGGKTSSQRNVWRNLSYHRQNNILSPNLALRYRCTILDKTCKTKIKLNKSSQPEADTQHRKFQLDALNFGKCIRNWQQDIIMKKCWAISAPIIQNSYTF